MEITRKYELIIVFPDQIQDLDLRDWLFMYTKNLRKFNVSNISVISRGKQKLAYPISKKLKGNYIQLNFSTMPKYILLFLNKLKIDSKVLRHFISKKTDEING